MKVAIVDTLYPAFLKTLPPVTDYATGLDYALSRFFGTHSAYSRHLRQLGHDVIDILGNHKKLQGHWAKEDRWTGLWDSDNELRSITLEQIRQFHPDVIFLQDLSYFDIATLRYLKAKHLLAGQLSCAFTDDEKLKLMDVLFTSFPFYVDRFNALGVRGEFLPLAFDPRVLERANIPVRRTHAVSFIGGYGHHWETDRLFTLLAERTPIQFWGYGFDKAPKVIRDRWQGEAWGLDMYDIYLRSHIVLNRHGGVSRGLSNNLRMFEATGCGAMLLTEHSQNIGQYFAGGECAVYESPEDAVAKINYFLSRPEEIERIAANGQRRTLATHTYSQRMKRVSEVLTECLERKAVSA